ncbi:MAG: sulfotransferase [Sphingomonadales bacterium]|nr:sulfotransferase [Sphingomonadales bacterium]
MADDFALNALMAEAQSRNGLTDFGDPAFREPAAIFAQALSEEANLTALGRTAMRETVIGYLGDRLKMEEWYRRNPEIDDEQIGDPLVIVGLPRTGTTMLYRMLAAAPGFAAPLHYEAASVSPAFDWDFKTAADPRIELAKTRIAGMLAAVPEIASIYPYEALAPEEDIYLYGASFVSTSMQSLARVPSYERWFDTADKAPAYRYLTRALKLLQWQRKRAGIRPATRWLLKTPDHIHSLDALLQAFPGAKIIQTHRDPVNTIPSISSFIRALHRLSAADVDSEGLGREWCRMFARSMNHAVQVRAGHPDHFLDILYADTVADPRGVAERVFAFLGESLDDDAWEEMGKWRDANQREARPSHHYSLEEFGLSPAHVKHEFAGYRKSFLGLEP